MKWFRTSVAALAGFAVLVYITPWVLYAVILSGIDGRPEPPNAAFFSEQDLEELRARYRLYGPAEVVPITPWDYIAALARGVHKGLAAKGTVLAWLIARRYIATHLEQRQWWHPAGAALTIWIRRSWTGQEIRAEALRIDREAEAMRKEIPGRPWRSQTHVPPDLPTSRTSASGSRE